MSESQPELPRVRTGEFPAVEAKPPALADVVWAAARWIVGQEWLMRLAAVAVLLLVGAVGVVYAQDAGVKLVAPVNARIDETNARVAALEKNQADMQRMTVETNATLKLVAMRLGVTPITLEQPKDGGL